MTKLELGQLREKERRLKSEIKIGALSTNVIEIKRIRRECHEQVYSDNYDNRDKIDSPRNTQPTRLDNE